jgi:hypothetical protein
MVKKEVSQHEKRIIQDLMHDRPISKKLSYMKHLIGVLIVLASVGGYVLFNEYRHEDLAYLILSLDLGFIIYLFIIYERAYDREKTEKEKIQKIKEIFTQTIIDDTLKEHEEKYK